MDYATPPPGRKSLFSESIEVMDLHYENLNINQVFESLANCIHENPDAELEYIEESKFQIKDLVYLHLACNPRLTPTGVNWLLLKLSDDNYVDYLLTNNQDRSKTLVFPLNFYTNHELWLRGNAGATALSVSTHKLSDYRTLIIPGQHPRGLFFAYVTLERGGGRIFAYSMETGQVWESVRQDVLHFVNSCLLAEFEDNRGRIARLTFDSGQPFYAAARQWDCDSVHDQYLLILAWTRYVLDRRIFDFDPGSADAMDVFRFYFTDLLVQNAR
jgi:hypothetical protein